MLVFRCVKCRAEVTSPVREVALPDPDDVRAPYEMADGQECLPRMAPGTFAVDPEPAGPPYVEASETGDSPAGPWSPMARAGASCSAGEMFEAFGL